MKSPGIYGIFNRLNGKCYVGSASCLAQRKRDHFYRLRAGTSHAPILQRAWNKYGEAAFTWCIIELVEDRNHLIEREQYWIDWLGACTTGYNTLPTAGSTLGRRHSEETRRKLSEATKSHPYPKQPKTPEHRAKISEGHKGKTKSAEHCRKMSEARKGKPLPPGATEKAAALNRGRSVSAVTRQRLADSSSTAILTPEMVRDIRERYSQGGISVKKLGELYGLSPSATWSAATGRTWKHI